jgi:hypothetical protein
MGKSKGSEHRNLKPEQGNSRHDLRSISLIQCSFGNPWPARKGLDIEGESKIRAKERQRAELKKGLLS